MISILVIMLSTIVIGEWRGAHESDRCSCRRDYADEQRALPISSARCP
jgi:hypothetical protein